MASESARRVELLNRIGYAFEAVKSGFPEVTLEDPKETAMANARGKALAVTPTESLVLAADTVVYLPGSPDGGQTLGKAESEQDVRRMLGLLRGGSHEVHTGVAVVREGEISEAHAITTVKMRPVADAEVEAYVETGEGVGKAGGYAIQGRAAAFVEWIGGDYSNVVGLPLSPTIQLLEHFGVRWY